MSNGSTTGFMKPIPSVQQLCRRRRGSCGGMKIASRGAKFSSKEGGSLSTYSALKTRRHGETYFVGCLRGHTEKFGYFQLSLNPSRAIVCECVLYSAPSLSPVCGCTCLALLCFGCPPPPPSASHRHRHISTWRTSSTDWLCFGISAVVFGGGEGGEAT